jgi:hypothetical protein
MKKTVISALFIASFLLGTGAAAWSQVKSLRVYRNGDVVYSENLAAIDSITYGDALAAPTGVSATLQNDSVIRVSWDSVPGAAGYELHRSSDNSTFVLLQSGIVETSYTDSTPLWGYNYYQVKALSSDGFVNLPSEASPAAIVSGGLSGSLAGPDTVHIHYKGDTVTLAGLFTGTLSEGTPRLRYAITAQPQKLETGFGTGKWETVNSVYAIAKDTLVVATDGLPATWYLPDVTDTKRELKQAVLTVRLYNGTTLVADKTVTLVQDSVAKEIVKIEAVKPSTAESDYYKIVDNTYTIAVPYASGVTFNGLTAWLSYSDSTFSNANSKMNIAEDYTVSYTYYVAIDGYNDGDPANLNEAAAINVGNPISRQTATSVYSYYVVRPTSVPAPEVGKNGYFDIYPYGTSKDDWRAIKVTVKPTTATGVIALPNNDYLEATAARKFRTGVKAAVQVLFYGFLAVAEGNPRPYIANENNNSYLLAIPGTINSVIEPILSSASYRTNSFLKPGAVTTSTDVNDYYGYAYLQLVSADTPVGTEITFKACPKNHFSADGVPDPAWTIDVVTKVYAN